jgi:ketosteroid isomerase-like protein
MISTAMDRLNDVFMRFEARDVEGVVALFAADGVFSDPNYPPPIGPTMTGHNAIRAGITWGLGIVEQPHFAVRHALTDDDSGRVAAVEVDTNHKLKGGAMLTFTQMFVGEANGDGLLRRMESYTSYPPPIAG